MPDVNRILNYPTILAPEEESQFQAWAKKNKVRLDPGWNEDYDMRGLWKSNPNITPDERGHWPDTYKLPNHSTFSNQSIYATPDAPRWYGRYLINNQGRMLANEPDVRLDLPNIPGPDPYQIIRTIPGILETLLRKR